MSGRYPEADELKRIKAWEVKDCAGCLDFARSIWNWPEYATLEGGMYRFATGGWSGNEDIIHSLGENHMLWTLCWQRSERGGLHWFKPWVAPPQTREGDEK